ncbi:MAG: hypothetical protein ACLQG3_17515 [Terracidiphilus sp.]
MQEQEAQVQDGNAAIAGTGRGSYSGKACRRTTRKAESAVAAGTAKRRRAISTPLRLGDLLIGGRMVTAEAIERAVEHQSVHGGRLGESLVAIDAVNRERLEELLRRMPAEPADIGATGVEGTELMGLLLKLIYAGRLESVQQFAQAIQLPYPLALDLVHMAVDRKLLMSMGSRDAGNLPEVAYALTDEGRRWAADLANHCGYVGPAPVPIEQFTRQVKLQRITNEVVTLDRIRAAMSGLTFEEELIEQCGPALNSGRATLLYGAPGNGKTSVAHRLANVFYDVIFVPYALDVDGQIIRVYDPGVHTAIERAGGDG